MRAHIALFVAAVTFVLVGCATAPADQITTLDGAVKAATLVNNAVDLYVNTAKPNVATLNQLQALRKTERAALDDLQAAAVTGQPLSFAAFTAARDALVAYATSNGVKYP